MRLAEFCRANGVRTLSLFGSILRGDFRAESDVDVLVEFLPGRLPSLFRLAGMQRELAEIIGRRVDLRTPAELSPLFRDRVVSQSRVQYAA